MILRTQFLVGLFFVVSQGLIAQKMTYSETKVSQIEQHIVLPTIPNLKIVVTKLGAKGDGVKDCKPAFDKAMKICKQQKGGTIVVPEGVYKLNGPIHFESHVNLHLEAGARLVFSSNSKDYPMVLTSWEGTTLYNYSPMIYGIDVTDVAITGTGTVDGEGHAEWATWKPLQKKAQLLSRDMNHNGIPFKERVFGEGNFLRPQLIQFVNSKNILIEDIKVEDAPFWCIHLLKSSSITLRGLKFDAHNKNNDGIDIENSSFVLIENVHFDNGDDNVAIKAGRDDDGRDMSHQPSENIIVRHCTFKGLHALVIGSEMSAGVKNVFAYNCEASGYLKRGVYVKTNSDRGGYIKDVYINDIQFKNVEDAIFITSNYHGEGSGLHPSKISNILLSNISFETVSNTGLVIEGYPKFEVENVILDHVTMKSTKNGMTLTNTKNIMFNEVIMGEKQGVPSFVK